MPLRQIEILLPRERMGEVLSELQRMEAGPFRWAGALEGDRVSIKTVSNVEDLEAFTDRLEARWELGDEMRVLVYPVEAVLPRLPEENGHPPGEKADDEKVHRLHREEIYARLSEESALSRNNAILMALSAVVAAVALMRGSEAILIGAMVIAPMLAPHAALALATTLGDAALAGRSILSGFVGAAIVLVVSVVIGLVFQVDPASSLLAGRSSLGLFDLAVALAAGSAGTLCYTMGAASAVVGVMVAVALVPPLAACGLLLGNGFLREAGGAAELFAANIVCLNLAGVLTFLFQGLRPNTWWDRKKAGRATWTAILVWAGLLAALAALVFFMDGLDVR